MNPKKQQTFAFVAGVILAVIDQVLKSIARVGVLNPGIAFGISVGWLNLVLQVVLSIAVIVVVRSSKDKWLNIGLLFILGVSISNLYDRVRLGQVIDYFKLFGFWVNLADVLISTVIAIMFVIYALNYVRTKLQSHNRKSSTKA